MRRNLLTLLLRASSQAAALQEARFLGTRSISVLASARGFGGGSGTFQPTSLKDALSAPSSHFPSSAHGQRRGMFIQTQQTPNPSSLMFVPGKTVLEGSGRDFGSARDAMASPLAKALFHIDGITQVYFGTDFLTVTKSDDYTWAVLKPDVFAAITEFYASGEPVMYDASEDASAAEHLIGDDDDEIVAMIKELLETRIRPAVQEDGGDIAFREFDPDSGVVTLKMMGACSGCPSSAITLKSGIESMLTFYIPEVKGVVEADPDEYENEGTKAFHKLEQHLSS